MSSSMWFTISQDHDIVETMAGNASTSLRHDGDAYELARSDEIVAKYFRVLGDPLRLAVLRLLRDHGQLSVEDIRRELGCKQARLSNQLACLRWCDFVTTRRDGNRIYYSIS